MEEKLLYLTKQGNYSKCILLVEVQLLYLNNGSTANVSY